MTENFVKIKALRRTEYNPRTMPETEMRALKESIMSFGFVEPVVVNAHECDECGDRKNILIGGHQRTTAVAELIEAGKIPQGIRLGEVKGEANPLEIAELPAIFVDFHIEQEKALNLALNKIKGKWDEEKLTAVIIELKGSPLIPATGFREDEVSRILDHGLLPDEEDGMGEGEADVPSSQFGEIYELGEHRLLCGDATDPEAYAKLLGDQKADIVFTDPPYNVAYHSRGKGLKGEGKEELKNDDLSDQEFARLIDRSFYEMMQRMKPGAAAYICSGWSSYPQFLSSLLKAGYEHSGVIIWVKNAPSMGWNDYRYKHEWIIRAKQPEGKKAGGIIYGWKKGSTTSILRRN